MAYIITEEQYNFLLETAKIRPWTDDDYMKVNPMQIKDIDFAKVKQSDDTFNANRKKGVPKRDSTSGFRQASGGQATAIKNFQSELTRDLQDRYAKEHGTVSVPLKDLGEVGNEELKNKLSQQGLELEVKGKTFSYGNTKVPENTLVVNLTSAFNCPSKNGDCQWGKRCYAHQTELQYKDTEARNLRNQVAFGQMSVKEILRLVETYIENAPIRLKYIRIHEDGDFQNQEVVDFCDKLCAHLKAKYGLQATAYTHRNLDYSNLSSLLINGSSYHIKNPTRYFMVTDKASWDRVPEGLNFDGKDLGIISIENGQKLDTKHGTFKCPCDCRQCMFCYRTKEENGEPADHPITVIETIH